MKRQRQKNITIVKKILKFTALARRLLNGGGRPYGDRVRNKHQLLTCKTSKWQSILFLETTIFELSSKT